MAQGVRAHLAREAALADVAVEVAGDAPRAKAVPAVIQKKGLRVGEATSPLHQFLPVAEVGLQSQGSLTMNWTEPLLRALSENPQHLALPIPVLKRQRAQLAHSQPSAVQHLEDGAVAQREYVLKL